MPQDIMKLNLKKIFITWVSIFFFCGTVAATEPEVSGRSSQKTFTLNQLSKIDTAVLKGKSPSYAFYIPIPNQWKVQSIDLNLVVSFSPLLLNSSSLTLMVGDTPVDSIQLNNTKEQPLIWRVTLPKASITKKITTVRLIGYMKLSNNVCQDIENQSNWVRLSGNSSVTYHYENKLSNWSLVNFPFPFIHKDAPFIDKVNFYLPIKTNAETFAPYFKFANVLSKEASWRGVEIKIKNMREFSPSATELPSIIIGTPDSIDFSLLGTPNALRLEKGQWLDHDGQPLSHEKGFIWLSRQGQQPTLIISSNSNKGLSTAIEAINSKHMHFTATQPSFFIAQPPSTPAKNLVHKPNLRFSDLGYQDSVIFGTGKNELNYQFNLPAQYANQPVKLTLNYSSSPFLQKERASTMSILLNGTPIHGVTLQPDSLEKNTVTIELPQKQLQLGKNTLTVTFDLLLSKQFCSRDYLSHAWASIYDDSHLHFNKSNGAVSDQIRYYPELMEGDVFVVLPDDPAAYQDKNLLKSIIRFASFLEKATSLTVTTDRTLDNQKTQQSLIYFATGKTNSSVVNALKASFMLLVENLNKTSNSTLRGIDTSIFINAFKQNQAVGFVGINSVGDQKKSTQLTLYGFSTNELSLATNLLTNTYKLNFLLSNLAVSFQNGTFTSLSSNDIGESVQREVAMDRVNQLTLHYLLYSIGGLLFIALVYIIWRAWRKKVFSI